MTLNARFNLKWTTRYVCCGFWSWLCVTEWAWPLLSATKLRPMNCTFRACGFFLRIFARVYCSGTANRSWAAKLGYYSHYAASSLRYLEMCSHLICIIMKALNGFLMIQKQITLKIYYVWKLHRSRMSHGLLADNVDTTLAYYIVVKQMWCSVKCTISERAEKDVRSWRALSALAELLVLQRKVTPLISWGGLSF